MSSQVPSSSGDVALFDFDGSRGSSSAINRFISSSDALEVMARRSACLSGGPSILRGDDDAVSNIPLSAARDGDGLPTIDAAVAAVASILDAPEVMASRRDSCAAAGCVGRSGGGGGGIATCVGGSRVFTGDDEDRHCASCIPGAYARTRRKSASTQELLHVRVMATVIIAVG